MQQPDHAPNRSGPSHASSLVSQATNKEIMKILAGVLTKLVLRNDSVPANRVVDPSPFNALSPPDITIESYLERLLKYMCCSDECTILALIYIDRIIQFNNQSFVLTSLNIHRLLITSLVVAAKFFDDRYYTNVYYAQVGGITVAELNTMELEFLFLINFSLHVCDDHYKRYYTELKKHVPVAPPAPVPVVAPTPQWGAQQNVGSIRRSSSRRELENAPPVAGAPVAPAPAAPVPVLMYTQPGQAAYPAAANGMVALPGGGVVPLSAVVPKVGIPVFPTKYAVPLPLASPSSAAFGPAGTAAHAALLRAHTPHMVAPGHATPPTPSGLPQALQQMVAPATSRRSPVLVVDPN